jgi:HlyD family secretion protein
MFTVDAYPNRTFLAKVTEVRFAPRTVQGVVTYETVLAVDNSDLSLRPGMTATADIVVKHVKDALLVPNAALRFRPPREAKGGQRQRRGLVSLLLPHRPSSSASEREKRTSPFTGKRFVWTLQNGKPSPIAVTVGATDGRMTEVLEEDIRPGMKLLTDVEVYKK